MEEEERLFYVATTRAKEELHITTCATRMGIASHSSPFIAKFFTKPIEELTKGKKYDKMNFETHRLFIKI